MSEFPSDILKAAENALDNLLCNCREAGDVRQDSIRDIAKAILAERERCAKIAEGASSLGRDWVPGSLWETLRRETAADIRNPAVRTPSTPPEGREQNT